MRRAKTVLQLLGFSLLVGWLMSVFDVTPARVYEGVADAVVLAWRWLVEAIGGRIGAALLTGATVVVPIWVVVHLVRRRWRRG